MFDYPVVVDDLFIGHVKIIHEPNGALDFCGINLTISGLTAEPSIDLSSQGRVDE